MSFRFTVKNFSPKEMFVMVPKKKVDVDKLVKLLWSHDRDILVQDFDVEGDEFVVIYTPGVYYNITDNRKSK
jgi:hypothetical protein